MADVPDSWDVINLAFGEPTSVTSGDIRFTLCPVAECPNVESEAEFKAAIKAKQAAGKKVLISIGGQNGQVQLATTAARDTFVSSVSKIIDEYGLDGLDIDFEGHSLSLDTGDTDFRAPTTPVIVNLISAVKTLKAKYGSGFVLTMAPGDLLRPARLPVLRLRPLGRPGPARRRLPPGHPRPARRPHPAARPGLQLGPDHGPGQPVPLDGRRRLPHRHDRHAAHRLPGRGQHQQASSRPCAPTRSPSACPASTNAGNGHTSPAEVNKALNCLTKKTDCGTYETHGTWPALRGLMTWSINWDRFGSWEF